MINLILTQIYKNINNNFQIFDFLDCLSTFSTTPIADIKNSKEVEPAEMNGKGKPVGGIEPLNISYCIINSQEKKRVKYYSLFFSSCEFKYKFLLFQGLVILSVKLFENIKVLPIS